MAHALITLTEPDRDRIIFYRSSSSGGRARRPAVPAANASDNVNALQRDEAYACASSQSIPERQ
jgi:hypothetical protein